MPTNNKIKSSCAGLQPDSARLCSEERMQRLPAQSSALPGIVILATVDL